jgi:hypothetical protein
MEFVEYFSEEAIIRELCRARIKHAAKRHDAQFFNNIDVQSIRPDVLAPGDWGNIPSDIFPPRRSWHRYRPERRHGTAPFALNVETLYRATVALRRLHPGRIWARNLAHVVRAIQSRVLSRRGFRFKRPSIVPIRKDHGGDFYRPLAAFPLPDKIVECLTARYFRVELDHALMPSCIAFRAKKKNRRPPTTHDAIIAIDDVRRKSRKLYVAECDIQGFFDCLSHAIARTALDGLIKDAKLKQKIHPRAVEIFEAYLASYTFAGRVLRGKEMHILKKRHPNATCKWPKDKLAILHGGRVPARIGVPQGGALSCFIANAVLHHADKALDRLQKLSKVRFTYLRYCDDMILLASTRHACKAAFDAYKGAVHRLLLPIHSSDDVIAYDGSFYGRKSNNPYPWCARTDPTHVPWIQFVGYQLRYDGLLRVRKKSIEKHLRRITEVTDKLIRTLDSGSRVGGLRKSAQQIYFRFHQKLISMSVGRIQRGRKSKGPMPMCWAAGFRVLARRGFVDTSIRYLDRHRERQLRRVERRLAQLKLPRAKKQIAKEVLPFYGYPFSYIAQFR